jgi:hypothetical protein
VGAIPPWDTGAQLDLVFHCAKWEEHPGQHNDRSTGTDREYQQQANALAETPPETTRVFWRCTGRTERLALPKLAPRILANIESPLDDLDVELSGLRS